MTCAWIGVRLLVPLILLAGICTCHLFSCAHAHGYRIQEPDSWSDGPGCRIQGPEPIIQALGSWILDVASGMLHAVSWIQDWGCTIQAHMSLNLSIVCVFFARRGQRPHTCQCYTACTLPATTRVCTNCGAYLSTHNNPSLHNSYVAEYLSLNLCLTVMPDEAYPSIRSTVTLHYQQRRWYC